MSATPKRIVLLVDSGTLPLMEQAVSLAALVQAQLEAVFIEDDELLQVASLPFSREVSLRTATVRRLSRERLQQEIDREFEQFRLRLEQTATRSRVQWECRRYVGSRREAWRESAQQVELLFAGGAQAASRRPAAGQRLKDMVYAVYNGTEAARNAVAVALSVAEAERLHLVVLIPETPSYHQWYQEAQELVQHSGISSQLVPVHHPDSMPNLKVMVSGLRGTLLFLPRELEILSPLNIDELLQVIRLPVIFVP